GIDIMPCSRCHRLEQTCRAAPTESAKCSGCLRANVQCDGIWVASTLNRVMAEDDRLKVREADAEQALVAAHQSLNESMARLTQLRKQRSELKSKGLDLISRGFSSLDELEEVEHAEGQAVGDLLSLGFPDVID
ncbi:hypothetical protein Micbo1qcDRAFT_110081, partial [Microdochium bolleyi]